MDGQLLKFNWSNKSSKKKENLVEIEKWNLVFDDDFSSLSEQDLIKF